MTPPITRAVATTAALLDRLSAEEREELEAGLARRGWRFALAASKRRAGGVSGGILTAAMAYREFNGLPVEADGLVLLKALRRPCCGLPDDTRIDPESGRPVERAITFGRWRPDYTVTVAYRFSRLPDSGDSLRADQVRAVIQSALDRWQSFCGLRMELIDDFERANVRVVDASIDRQHGVLADMYLPGPGEVAEGHVCKGRIDWNEAWGLRTAERPTLPDPMAIDLDPVWAHEFGHALGLDHEPGQNAELMNPMYWPSPTVWTSGKHWLGPKDTRTAQAAYGPPRATPAPKPDPTPTPKPVPGPRRVNGRIDGYLYGEVKPLLGGLARVKGVYSGQLDEAPGLAAD